MLLKFREIEVFWAVYKSKSVKEAARLLHVSQPAVSMMLKSAEERFGVKLFDRSGGRVGPTPEARALFDVTDGVFAQLGEFERQLNRIRDGRIGLLRIAATPTLSAAFVHPALSAFRMHHPDVRVILNNAPTVLVHELVTQSRADIGIAYGPPASVANQTEDLGFSEFACVLRKDHRLTAKSLLTPADLKGEQVLTYRPDTPFGRGLEKALRGSSALLNIALEGTALAAAHLAEQGFGVALIDPFILNGGLFQSLTVRPFKPTTRARVQIVTSRQEPISMVAHDFLTELRKAMPREFSYVIPLRAKEAGSPD